MVNTQKEEIKKQFDEAANKQAAIAKTLEEETKKQLDETAGKLEAMAET